MADLPPPGKTNQGQAGDPSSPDTGQGNTDFGDIADSQNIEGSSDDAHTVDNAVENGELGSENDVPAQEGPAASGIVQRLAQETPGVFEFEINDDSINFIQGEDDYRQALQDYERANDHDQAVDDFPTDPTMLHMYVEEICQALINWEGAIGLVNAAGKPSSAVNRIKKLKKSEIVLLAWMLLFAIRDAQRGKSRGVYGDAANLLPQRFDSWRQRHRAVINILQVVKNSVFRLIKERESFAYTLAAQPSATSARQDANRVSNEKKAMQLAQVKKAKQQSDSSPGPNTTSTATGNPQDQSIPRTSGPFPTRDSRDGQGDLQTGPSIGEKRKQPSMDPRGLAKGQPKAPPATSRNGSGAPQDTPGVHSRSIVPARGLMKRPSQGNRNSASTPLPQNDPPAQQGRLPVQTGRSATESWRPNRSSFTEEWLADQAARTGRKPLPLHPGHKPVPKLFAANDSDPATRPHKRQRRDSSGDGGNLETYYDEQEYDYDEQVDEEDDDDEEQ